MTPGGFSGIWELLCVVFSGNFSRTDEKAQDVWFKLLESASDEDVVRRTGEWCRTEHFPPKPADLLGHTGDSRQYAEDVADVHALEAWAQAIACLDDPYKSYTYEDRLVPQVIQDLVGAQSIRDRIAQSSNPQAEEAWVRKEFLALYRKRAAVDAVSHSGHVIGLIEKTNTESGHTLPELDTPQVVAIGGNGARRLPPPR